MLGALTVSMLGSVAIVRLALAALIALAAAIPAHAADRFRSLGPIDDQPAVGWRELAWRSAGKIVHYRDSLSHRRRVFASSCHTFDVDAGRILLGCEEPATLAAPYLADAATGRIDAVPGAQEDDFYVGLGRFWLQGIACSPKRPDECEHVSLNWHTGQRVTFDADPGSSEPRPAPSRTQRARIAGPHGASALERRRLLLRRRGRPDLLLSRCPGGCHEAQYSFGRVFWLQGNRIHGYDPATRKRQSLPVPTRQDLEVRVNGYEAAIISRNARGSRAGELFVAPWPR